MAPYYGFYQNPRNYGNYYNSRFLNNSSANGSSMSALVEKDAALWKNLGWDMKSWANNIDGYGPYGRAYNNSNDRQSWLSAFLGGSNNVGDPQADQADGMGRLVSAVAMMFFG